MGHFYGFILPMVYFKDLRQSPGISGATKLPQASPQLL